MKTILITGAAGFIGMHLSKILCKKEHHVIGYDNINDYYDVALKYGRLHELGVERTSAEVFHQECKSSTLNFTFYRANLEDLDFLSKIFEKYNFDIVINLAAQAGVRYSIENPHAYGQSNLVGFLNILECCRQHKVSKLMYASSSSVYGNSVDVPFSTSQNVDHPISLYAATKKANELMAHSYSHLYKIKTVGLRFFTVYGPWGRPDMAMFLFTDAICNNRPIKVFNHGDLSRDFTYIDDIVQGITKLVDKESNNLYQLYNIGNSKPVQLMDFIQEVERSTGIKAQLEMMPMQPGDVNQTWADVDDLISEYDYQPNFPVAEGVSNFVQWYKAYYNK
ncbi:MAG: GDP-mannose 4,6-dehydratase [Weeksellaceae bacterium]|nr:GDP-mannose 4,6-dehydratase [Weeksellaceae bacterium]